MAAVFHWVWRALTEPPPSDSWKSQWGLLIFNLSVLGFALYLSFVEQSSYKGDPYEGLLVPVMLFLNQFAFFFRWPLWLTVFLRIFAVAWLLFTPFYFFYLGNVLFPAPR